MSLPPDQTSGFVGYDKRGRFLHFCHCGAWGAFGYDVKLLHDKLGTWYCREHRPARVVVEVFVAEPAPAQPPPVDDNRDLFEILGDDRIT